MPARGPFGDVSSSNATRCPSARSNCPSPASMENHACLPYHADEAEGAITHESFDGACRHSALLRSRSCSTIPANFSHFRPQIKRAFRVIPRVHPRCTMPVLSIRNLEEGYMGRAHLTAVASAFAFGLATAIIAAQAPAGQKPAQAPAAQPGGPPPNPADPSLPQGQGGGRGTGAPVIQAARAAIKGSGGLTGSATLYEISNSGNGHGPDHPLRRERASRHAGVHILEPACEAPTSERGGHFRSGSRRQSGSD